MKLTKIFLIIILILIIPLMILITTSTRVDNNMEWKIKEESYKNNAYWWRD